MTGYGTEGAVRALARNGLLFGGDYNPEQWPREVWQQDVELMAEARVNTVVLGVFSWSSLEPEEGVHTFGWLDDAIALLHEHGIGVVLATPTASPPPWFTLAHPEAMPVTEQGVRLVHGSRDTYDPAAPAYRTAAASIAGVLAERYGRHPALVGWHVHNEYGTVSHGPEAERAFRAWLAKRYGTIDELNRAWHTAFWSQGYRDWSEVLAPRATQYLHNPTQALDFKRFSAAILLECYEEQIAVIRSASPDVPVTTNVILPDWLNYDQWAFAAASDIVAVDHYIGEDGLEGAAQTAFGADLARSFGDGKPWLLAEQAAHVTVRPGAITARPAGEYARTSIAHIARGSIGALTFQWRAPFAGAESFHSSMVPHAGADTRRFREVVALGRRLELLRELAEPPAGKVVRPRVAIAWDPGAWWASETRSLPSDDLSFLRSVRGTHRALWNLGHPVDFVQLDEHLADYRVLLLPSQLLLDGSQRLAVERFVRAGGTLVAWYCSGTFDEELHVIPGGYSGALSGLLGIRVTELHPLLPGTSVVLDDGTSGSVWSEAVEPAGADVISAYAAGALEGGPAITRHATGDGLAYYLSTELDGAALEAFLGGVLAEAGCEPDALGAGAGLDVLRRYAGTSSYLFVANHSTEAREVQADGLDLLSGHEHGGVWTVAPGTVRLIRER